MMTCAQEKPFDHRCKPFIHFLQWVRTRVLLGDGQSLGILLQPTSARVVALGTELVHRLLDLAQPLGLPLCLSLGPIAFDASHACRTKQFSEPLFRICWAGAHF